MSRAAAPLGLLKLPRRIHGALTRAGLLHMSDVAASSDEELLRVPGVGHDSLGQIRAALKQWRKSGSRQAGGSGKTWKHLALRDHIELELVPYAPRDDRLWLGRMGLDGEIRMLESLGTEYGISRERVRQLTERILASMRHTLWAQALGEKVSRLLRDRKAPLYLDAIADEDPWFRGFEGRSLFLASVVARCSPSPVHTWPLGGRWVAAEIGEDEWNALRQSGLEVLEELAERRAGESEVMERLDSLAVAAGAGSLNTALKDSIRPSLQFRSGPGSGRRKLLAVGDTPTKAVRAVLLDAGEPLPIDELRSSVSQRLGRRMSVVGLRRAMTRARAHPLAERRYGLVEQLDFTDAERARLVRHAERLVRSGRVGRQWHAAELVKELTAVRPDLAGRLDGHALSAMLRESGKLRDLRRMMWGHPAATRGHGEGRKSVVEVFEAVLEEAGRPLKPGEIRRAAINRRGFSANFQVYPAGRLVKLEGGYWGLEGRDTAK